MPLGQIPICCEALRVVAFHFLAHCATAIRQLRMFVRTVGFP